MFIEVREIITSRWLEKFKQTFLITGFNFNKCSAKQLFLSIYNAKHFEINGMPLHMREALAGRFKGIPDVHYGDDRHRGAGERGVLQWTLTGTTAAGVSLKVYECDLWEFRDGKIIRKETYWKIVEP